MAVQVWGARGTLPVADPNMAGYGGNTSCVSVQIAGAMLVLDAGSGIVPLGQHLRATGQRQIDLIVSHAHYDHVLGLPFFAPLQDPQAEVTLWFAGTDGAESGAALVAQLIRAPFLPFTPADLPAKLSYRTLPRRGTVSIAGATVHTLPVNHPGGNTGIRLDHAGRSLVYVADFEQDEGAQDAALVAFMEGADLAFLDATYTPADYATYAGYGHAHWRACLDLAARAGVARCGLFHHSPARTDTALDAIARDVAAADPAAHLVREGAVYALAPD